MTDKEKILTLGEKVEELCHLLRSLSRFLKEPQAGYARLAADKAEQLLEDLEFYVE